MADVLVEIYVTAGGGRPFREWCDELEPIAEARVLSELAKMQDGKLGNHKALKGQDSEGMAEIRIMAGGFRVYYGWVERGRHAVILCGGTKKRQTRDIDRAKEFWKQYKQETG